MTALQFVSPNEIRAQFSRAMSEMYQAEVPQYGTLLTLVSDVNQHTLQNDTQLAAQLKTTGETERLSLERHGAIRVGTAAELATLRKLFKVMGMAPVGYYDLAVAGVPVHSTAFRAVHEEDLQLSPFRIFTSLLRLELIDNLALRHLADTILARRNIFTPQVLELIALHEAQGGLTQQQATEFIQQALETFRWHSQATISAAEYQLLHEQHRLIADVVAFKGPHINHLTPRTLDIDSVQLMMPQRGITPKAIIEGPPQRNCPILLRQTSFKALEEKVDFIESSGEHIAGCHTARFGEIEQRGAALTAKGRALYDRLLQATNEALTAPADEKNASTYYQLLAENFRAFPDDYETLHNQGLAWFRYFPTESALQQRDKLPAQSTLAELIKEGIIQYQPLVYEDFLPVSAAGIFRSNLGDTQHAHYQLSANKAAFEEALGATIIDEMQLYQQTQQRSLENCAKILNIEIKPA